MRRLNAIVIKPSKYGLDGYVERFRWGFMPNATIPFIASMIDAIGDTDIRVTSIDEYVQTNVDYLDLFDAKKHGRTLVMLVGVQSHQFHRALDLAALAVSRGCMAVIGGPHPMTCETTMLQGRGVSFALAEAEVILQEILSDASQYGVLSPVYGKGQRWTKEINTPVLKIPPRSELRRYVAPLLGVYPARGCPFICNFCSIIKIAGRNIRTQDIGTTMKTLKAAQAEGVKVVMFTSDNFNKYHDVVDFCQAIIDEKLRLRFFAQCDTQIADQEQLVELFARAGFFEIFLGVESLNLKTLQKAHKNQNRPAKYRKIRDLCAAAGIGTHFSMINGFPDDTYQSVMEQLEQLIEIDPNAASFYTLCPIPGTEQYKDFMQQDLIYERNLDRFDGISPTWRHPRLSPADLVELFRTCYRKFYSLKHVRRHPQLVTLGNTLFSRLSAFRGNHPMSGGVWRRRADRVDDYSGLRQRTYGYTHVPLPDNLDLSPEEQAFNDKAKITVPDLSRIRPEHIRSGVLAMH